MIKLIKYSSESVNVEISHFQATSCDQLMVMLHNNEQGESFERQVDSIFSEYSKIEEKYNLHTTTFKRIFLSDAANQTDFILTKCANDSCAISIIEQPPLNGGKIALLAILKLGVEVKKEGYFTTVKNGDYTELFSCNNTLTEGDSREQTYSLFTQYRNALKSVDATLSLNSIRTWLYVQNVDVNYGGVVTGRNEIFDQENLTAQTHFISSTGIEGRTTNHNSSVMMDSYSVKGINESQIQFLYAPTHLNNTAEYGVRFERGTALLFKNYTEIYISGTASINNKGEVLHIGNIEKQTERMVENIEKLLSECNASMDDIMQMTIYLRDIADYKKVANYFELNYPITPKVIVKAPVCRPTWLIECECIALKATE